MVSSKPNQIRLNYLAFHETKLIIFLEQLTNKSQKAVGKHSQTYFQF